MGIGLVFILLSYPSIAKALKISLPISDLYAMIIGVVIVLVGAFLGFWRSGEKHEEVPIYHGKKVIGFRRITQE